MALLRPCALILLIIVLIAAFAGAVLAEEVAEGEEKAPDTPLQSRAKDMLESFPQAKTKESRVEIRAQLLAMADTLEAAGDDVLASHCLERAGMTSYRLAEYESAEEIWERGVVVAKRSGEKKRIAALLNAQAVGVSITGDNEGAITLQLELIGLRREMEDARGEGVSWHNLAFSYFALFRYPEAIDATSNALRLHREAGNAFGVAGSMSLLSNGLFEVGQKQDALAMADSAVARARDLGNPSVLGSSLQGRARQLHYAGRYEAALSDFEEAHHVLTSAGVANVAAVNDINWANALISLQQCDDARRVIDQANLALAPIGSPEAIVWGECISARVMARCGDAAMARYALLATIGNLEATRDSIPDAINRADAFRMAGGAYTDLAMLEIRDDRPEEAWFTVESSTARLFGEALGLDARSSLDDLQARLSAIDAVALQFGHGSVDRNVLCVVTPTDVRAWTLEIPPGLALDVGAALRLMSSGASDDECAAVLERIAGTILAPAAEVLATAGERIVVIPGDLAGFPIEALPLTDGTPLGERFAVTYAPSATAFVHLQDIEPSSGSVVVFADPDLGAEAGDGLEVAMRGTRMSLVALPEARAEGRAVGGTLLVGSKATRSAFLERAGDAGVVHVAAHAVVDGTHPEYSGIVLAGEGGDLLTVEDLGAISLGADLVSLSGCETAGGYVATGDGAFGLTRAFLLAGARSVVSSWWDVEDAAARRFMELYYEALRNGAERDMALKEVRVKMAAQGYPHRDRTAFALTGATAQPVVALATPSTSRRNTGVGAGAVVLIIVIVIAARRRREARAA